MQIQSLSIKHIRNLQPSRLHFSNQLNIFFGDNAAGKSSLLEALYILGNGRSFRTAKHSKVINDDQESYIIFSEIQSSGHRKLGLQRQKNGDIKVKLDGEPLYKLSNLATVFPVQVLAPEQYELLSKGPSARRKLLDWGVFHVEHSFLSLWQRCNKLLLQRNQLLKTSRSYSEIEIWDKQLIPLSELITNKREEYCNALNPLYQNIAKEFLPELPTHILFHPGWTANKSLTELLPQQYDKDKKLGFTQSSIQKADLKIYSGKRLAAEYLSRGQQKLVITALKLAQLTLMQQQGKDYPIFLLDDIGAELDSRHQEKLFNFLAEQPEQQQIFITCVHLDPLKALIKRYNKASMFHVEHGHITQYNDLN